jgi:hypothetical protein
MNENLNAVLMRSIMQSYVEMLISSLITVTLTPSFLLIIYSKSDAFCYFSGTFFFFYIILLPMFIQSKLELKFFYIEVKNCNIISKEYIQTQMYREKLYDEKWGAFYEGLNEKHRFGMMYNYFFILRRQFFVFTAFYWYDYVAIQIASFILVT